MGKYNVHAGHCPDGGTGCGAVGLIKESTEARKVKDSLIAMLKGNGDTVYDCTCNTNVSASSCLSKIVAMCNAHTVDYDISIHLNSGAGDSNGNGSTTGTEVLIYASTSASAAMAQKICDQICADMGYKNRGVKIRSDLYVLKNTSAPAILVECCFVDDKDDVNNWDADKCATAIYKALGGAVETNDPINDEGLYYRGHVQNLGDTDVMHDGMTVGVTGKSLRLEGLYVDLRTLSSNLGAELKLNVKQHIQNVGWQTLEDVQHDTLIGTEGESKRLECISLEIENLPSDKELCYQAHIQNIGWSSVTKGGYPIGTMGQSLRIEAMKIWICDK